MKKGFLLIDPPRYSVKGVWNVPCEVWDVPCELTMFQHFVFNCCTVPGDCRTFETWDLAVEHRLLWMDLWRLYTWFWTTNPWRDPQDTPSAVVDGNLDTKGNSPSPSLHLSGIFLNSTEKSNCYQILSCRHKGHCHLSQRNCDDPRIPSTKSALLSLPPWKRNGGGIRSSPDAATSPSFCRMKLCPTTHGLRVLVFIGGRKLSKGRGSDPILHLWRNCHSFWGEPWVTKLFESYLHSCKWSLAPARMSKSIEITESPA